MSDKPGKPEGRADTEPAREDPPPRTENATSTDASQKKKPGDAARKMRAMFKGR